MNGFGFGISLWGKWYCFLLPMTIGVLRGKLVTMDWNLGFAVAEEALNSPDTPCDIRDKITSQGYLSARRFLPLWHRSTFSISHGLPPGRSKDEFPDSNSAFTSISSKILPISPFELYPFHQKYLQEDNVSSSCDWEVAEPSEGACVECDEFWSGLLDDCWSFGEGSGWGYGMDWEDCWWRGTKGWWFEGEICWFIWRCRWLIERFHVT